MSTAVVFTDLLRYDKEAKKLFKEYARLNEVKHG